VVYLICMLGDVVLVGEVWDVVGLCCVVSAARLMVFDRRRDFEVTQLLVGCDMRIYVSSLLFSRSLATRRKSSLRSIHCFQQETR
jgi:hypothetical protein